MLEWISNFISHFTGHVIIVPVMATRATFPHLHSFEMCISLPIEIQFRGLFHYQTVAKPPWAY